MAVYGTAELPRFTAVPETLEISDDGRSDLSTERWNSDDEPPVEKVNDRMVISRDGSLIRTVLKVGVHGDSGMDRPGRYDRVRIRFMDISSHCGEFTSLEAATWADRGEGLEFEVGTCDPRIPSAIDVGVRYMTVGSVCRIESPCNPAWRLPYDGQEVQGGWDENRPTRKRFQFMASPPRPSSDTINTDQPVVYIIHLEGVDRCYVLHEDGLVRRWVLRRRDPRRAWKAPPKVGDKVAIVVDGGKVEERVLENSYLDRVITTMRIGEKARITILVPGHEKSVDELELIDVLAHGWVVSPRDDKIRLLEKQEMYQSMGLPLGSRITMGYARTRCKGRSLMVEEGSKVAVGIMGAPGVEAVVLQWICGCYCVHPIFDAMVRSMRVGERALFTPSEGVDREYLCDKRLCVNRELEPPIVLNTGTSMEEAISKSVDTCSGEAQRLSAVEERGQLLSEFDFPSCEMVLISVDEEENEASDEAVLRRSRLWKNTGNRLLAAGALSEARSEYMKALSTLRLMQRPPLEEPSDEEKALELAVVLNLALLCLKQADYSEGQLFATRAREIDPDNIKARYRLALALVGQHKQTDEAVVILKGILEECSEARSLLHRLKKDMQGDRKREENLFKSMFRA